MIKNVGSYFSFFVLSASLVSCSPVKFNAKSTDPNPPSCVGDQCTPPPCTDGCPPPEVTSVWRTGDWGLCSQSCGGGTQSRSVACVSQDNVVLPEDRCKELKPVSSQACNTQSCTNNSPSWNVGAWSLCSATCGGGTQSRVVECRDSSGVRPDSACVAAKPATQQNCNTQACVCTPVNKSLNATVPAGNNKVDILIVVDDSGSMIQDNTKLAARLNGFVSELQSVNIDWQMCITTTDVGYYEGRPIQWSGTTTRVINKSTPNLSTIFQQTINDIGSGFSNDEQGIKASIFSVFSNPVYPCYRPEAAFASIIISDEDERSVGGNAALSSQQVQPLGLYNQPSTFVSVLKGTFGPTKRMAVNSIVVQDNQCKQLQDPQGSPAFIGTKYIELANLTNGSLGNICDTDYSTNLKYFKDSILNTLSNVDLECTPVGTPTVNVPTGTTWSLTGKRISFTPALNEGATVSITYQCCP